MDDWNFTSNDMDNKKQRKKKDSADKQKKNNKTGTNLKNQSEPMAH